jgi:soluble P-type ATPase
MRTLGIPNYGKITIKNVVFDINGTIQFDGKISKRLITKIKKLKEYYDIFFISADTRGNLNEIALKLGVKSIRITTNESSEAFKYLYIS